MKSRKNRVALSAVSALSFQILNLFIGMFIPKFVISIYGSEVNGLYSNIIQLLNIINLLQAGMIAASAYEMYKPIADKNYQKIGKIYYSAKKYFINSSYLLIAFSLIFIPVLLYGKSNKISFVQILLSVIILTLNSAIIFRYYCKYDLIFSSHQEKHILFISMYLEKFIYYPLVFICLRYKLNYNMMYLSLLISSAIKILFLHFKFKKRYEPLIKEYSNETNYKVKNQVHVLGNQIIFRVVDTFPILLVTQLYGLFTASVYSVYIMVISIFKTISDTLQNTIAPSFGDLYATKDFNHCTEIIELIQFLYSISINTITPCLVCLLAPFVGIYVGGSNAIKYVHVDISFYITIQFVCYSYYFLLNMIVNSTGIYKSVFKGNIVCLLISIVFTLILTLLDFRHVFLGISIFYILGIAINYYVINDRVLSIPKKQLIRPTLSIGLVIIYKFCFSDYIINYINFNIMNFIVIGIVSFIFGLIISIIIAFIFDRNQFKELTRIIKEKFL